MARQCTCGSTLFYRASSGADVVATVERWIAVDVDVTDMLRVGHGVTPQGTLHGSGDEMEVPIDSGYALVRSSFTSRDTSTRCKRCDRIRTSAYQGGIALFGTYYDDVNDRYYFVVHSVEEYASYKARVVGQVQAVDVELPLFVSAGAAENAATVNTVLTTAAAVPPGGAQADGLLYADVSSITLPDTYDVKFVDSVRGTELNANTFTVA